MANLIQGSHLRADSRKLSRVPGLFSPEADYFSAFTVGICRGF